MTARPQRQKAPKKKRGDYGREPKRRRGDYGLSVPEAGELIGLGRSAAYAAARAGEIPTIKVGSLVIVPRVPWLKKLGIETEAAS